MKHREEPKWADGPEKNREGERGLNTYFAVDKY